MECVADTTLLIDLWRAQRHPEIARAITEKLGDPTLRMSWMAEAEFLRGSIYKNVAAERTARFLARFLPLPILHGHARRVAETASDLQKRGLQIDIPDLWIAAAALDANLPVATRNTKHYGSIAGLTVLDYAVPSGGQARR